MASRPEFYYCKKRGQYRKRIVLDGRERDVWANTKEELRELVREMQNAVESGLILDDDTTVNEFAAEWFEIKKAGLSYSGREMYANAINTHISPVIGRMKLKDVKPLHIQKILAASSDKSRSLQNKVLNTARQIFRSAVGNGLIVRNPCENIVAGGRITAPKVPLTPERQEEILANTKGTRAYVFVALALYSGLRREEILGLRWDSVHLNTNAPYLSVNRVVTFEGNRGILSDKLKSKAALRDIPLPEKLTKVLHDAKRTSKSIFVVPSAKGDNMSQVGFQRLWEIVRDRISFETTPHILRHTYITRLCDSGLDIKKIQYLAGHSDVQMTLNIYECVKCAITNSELSEAPRIAKAPSRKLQGALDNSFELNCGSNAASFSMGIIFF